MCCVAFCLSCTSIASLHTGKQDISWLMWMSGSGQLGAPQAQHCAVSIIRDGSQLISRVKASLLPIPIVTPSRYRLFSSPPPPPWQTGVSTDDVLLQRGNVPVTAIMREGKPFLKDRQILIHRACGNRDPFGLKERFAEAGEHDHSI